MTKVFKNPARRKPGKVVDLRPGDNGSSWEEEGDQEEVVIEGLDREVLQDLLVDAVTPEMIQGYMEKPHTAEKMVAFSYRLLVPFGIQFVNTTRALRQKGHIRTGAEMVNMLFPLDQMETIFEWLMLVQGFSSDEPPEGEAPAKSPLSI